MRTWLTRNAVWLGAVAGAVGLPIVYIIEFALYAAFRTGMKQMGAFWVYMWLARSSVVVLSPVGLLLGCLSADAWKGWLTRDLASLKRDANAAAVFTILCAAFTCFQMHDSDNIRSLEVWFLALAIDTPLQWSIALAVLARIAANRLKREQAQS